MFAIIFILSLIVFIAGIIYLSKRALRFINFFHPFENKKIFYVITSVLGFFPLLFAIGSIIPPSPFARAVSLIGSFSIGFYMYVILMILVEKIVEKTVKYIVRKKKKKKKNKKITLPSLYGKISGCVVIFCALAISVYGLINSFYPVTKEYHVSLTESKTNKTDGLKIALISDLHIGSEIGKMQMHNVVNSVNETNPDIILIAGDVFNDKVEDCYDLKQVEEELSRLESRLGVYACLGNHDPSPYNDALRHFFTNANITLLSDEYIDFGSFYVLGRVEIDPNFPDIQRPQRHSLKDIPVINKKTKPVIVLDHQPAGIDEAIDNEVDLVLSGHTHRGQIFPIGILAGIINGPGRFYGYNHEKETDIIITGGVGYWGPPMRIGSDTETVVIYTDLTGYEKPNKK